MLIFPQSLLDYAAFYRLVNKLTLTIFESVLDMIVMLVLVEVRPRNLIQLELIGENARQHTSLCHHEGASICVGSVTSIQCHHHA